MPPPPSTQYDNGRELLRLDDDHDHEIDNSIGHADLTRFGPDPAGVKIQLPLAFSSTTSSNNASSSKNTRSAGEFSSRPQHNATLSIATSVASTSSDVEAIELSAFYSPRPRRTDRAQSFVGVSSSHGRFGSVASSSTVTSFHSSSSTSASDDEYVYGDDEIGVRPVVPLSLERADTHPRTARPNSHPQNPRPEEESLDDGPSHESTPPLTPMSPRQTRFAHRIYVPDSSHHDDVQIPPNDFSEVDINSPSSSGPVRHSPESEHTLAVETDSLLPIQKPGSPSELPLPATSPNCDEPNPIRFSYSLFETLFHLFGFSITTVLVVLSIWLTLANIVM